MYITKQAWFLIGCILLSFFSFCLALSLGSVHFEPSSIFSLFENTHSTLEKTIIWQIRLPESANAFVVGALLALAGTLMQALLRNPLADPYILGISGGAAVASLIGITLGLTVFWLHLLAYLGALFAMCLVFILAKSPSSWSPIKLLLTGVVIAAGWGAIISFILSVSSNRDLHGLLFWLIGNVQSTRFSWIGFCVLILGFAASFLFAKPMDLLLHGETTAKALGVNVAKLYTILYLVSAMLTAVAVSIAGTIGFVGLVVPHIVRLCIGSRHRYLLIAVVFLGGSLLLLADTLARSLFAPLQLPVGIFTAFLGVPIFLYLLIRE